MTIDERLDRLTERHEALTQSVELLVHATQQNAENIAKLVFVMQSHERRLTALEGGEDTPE